MEQANIIFPNFLRHLQKLWSASLKILEINMPVNTNIIILAPGPGSYTNYSEFGIYQAKNFDPNATKAEVKTDANSGDLNDKQ